MIQEEVMIIEETIEEGMVVKEGEILIKSNNSLLIEIITIIGNNPIQIEMIIVFTRTKRLMKKINIMVDKIIKEMNRMRRLLDQDKGKIFRTIKICKICKEDKITHIKITIKILNKNPLHSKLNSLDYLNTITRSIYKLHLNHFSK